MGRGVVTPAVVAARKARIAFVVHEDAHDPEAQSYGLEAAEKLGLDPARVFKTLVVEGDDGALAVGIIPVVALLSMKLMARAIEAKKATLAERGAAQRATGYVMGGISPLGQKKRLRTVLDDSALAYPTIYVSGGRRGLDLELAPTDLLRLSGATTAALCA